MKFKYLILSAMAVLAISCTKEEYTLSGTGEKTPLEVSVSLDDSYRRTKAVNGTFEENDQLYAYVQQVARSGAQEPYTYESKIAKLVEFTVGKTESTVVTDDLGTVLYWDDFSSNDNDIRDDDRFLRVEYGFCFNGGTPGAGLTGSNVANGIIQNWSVASDQSNAANLKHSDLLWANHSFVKEQDPSKQAEIKYVHTVSDRKPLPVVYKHAMNKITVDVVLSDGFTADASGKVFSGSNDPVKLFANTSSTEVNAKAQTINTTVADESSFIKMKMVSDEVVTDGVSDRTRVYEAIIAPTVMKDGKKLLEITVDGNTYHINLTDDILKTVYPAASGNETWASHLKAYTIADGKLSKNSPEESYDAGRGGTTLPGVNYKLVVNLKKQRIEVSASIVDWENVTASAEGEIIFDSDVTATGDIDGALKTAGFDVYKNDVNTSFTTKTTSLTWSTDKWVYDPVIYWTGQADYSYFRALSPAGSTTAMSQGNDILWGYACDDVDADGSKVGTSDEVQINPRTGNVPLTFKHAMSKISVKLETTDGEDKVDLTNAKISIINLYDGGTLDMVNGNTEALKTISDTNPFTIENASQIKDQIVIPQSLTKLANGSERGVTPTFYQTSELTKIYSDDTSMPTGGGDGTYYLTSTLTPVNYDAGELTGIYSNGTSIDDGSTPETYVTASLDFIAYQAPVNYTQPECDEENAKHLANDSEGRKPDEPGYEKTYEQGYNELTTSDIKTPEVQAHYAVNANSIKATTSTHKCYKKSDSSEQHTPGELRSVGNKIMMYVTLEDGSRYSIEMSKCITANDLKPIQEWKRGEHYTYEITLGKEQITFRALIKQWDEKTGSGSATLDWD